AFMWLLTSAIFLGCKWLTFRRAWADGVRCSWRRALGYLLLWPGMDARAFLSGCGKAPTSRRTPRFGVRQLAAALGNTALGGTLMWGAARFAIAIHPLVAGWVGMLGLIFLLHFG